MTEPTIPTVATPFQPPIVIDPPLTLKPRMIGSASHKTASPSSLTFAAGSVDIGITGNTSSMIGR